MDHGGRHFASKMQASADMVMMNKKGFERKKERKKESMKERNKERKKETW